MPRRKALQRWLYLLLVWFVPVPKGKYCLNRALLKERKPLDILKMLIDCEARRAILVCQKENLGEYFVLSRKKPFEKGRSEGTIVMCIL